MCIKKIRPLFTHQWFLVNPVFCCASSHTLTLKTQHANLSEEHTVSTGHLWQRHWRSFSSEMKTRNAALFRGGLFSALVHKRRSQHRNSNICLLLSAKKWSLRALSESQSLLYRHKNTTSLLLGTANRRKNSQMTCSQLHTPQHPAPPGLSHSILSHPCTPETPRPDPCSSIQMALWRLPQPH